MKKYLFFAAAFAALLSVSCTKENNVPAKVGATTLEASLSPLGKTTIDGVKVSWAEGDAISVNGVGSESLSQGGATATFTMTSEVNAPYCAVYPSIIYYGDEIVELSDVMYLEQCTSIPMAAYSDSKTSLSFKPLTAIIKIPVTGEDGVSLATVTLKSNGDEQVSGPFGIDYTVPELIGGLDGTYKTITVNCENAPLSSTPTYIYIPVPAGTYASGLEIEFKTASDITITKGTNARTLAVGELRSMPEVHIAAAAPTGIYNTEDLIAFAEAVNSGAEDLSKWQNKAGEIALMADIDLSSYSEWTPIGYPEEKVANGANGSNPAGAVFTGIFNGGGHTIKNFKPTVSVKNNNTWGLFGVLKAATVKDLVINCDITISAEAKGDAGVVAGTMICSTVSNVTVNGKLTTAGNKKDNNRFALGGIAGYICGNSENGPSTIENCEVTLSVSGNSGVNTKSGATGVMFGGMAGYSTTDANGSNSNSITDCTFRGEIKLDAGRVSGILATAYCNTALTRCTTYADQTNAFVNARIGNVLSYAGDNAALYDCVNYGNLFISNEKTHVGGIVGLLDKTSNIVEGGANYGNIYSANADSPRHSGLIGGNLVRFDHISGVTVSGKLAVYGGDFFAVDASNFMDYIGPVGEGFADKITGLTYVAP
ncbi:MAG: hypothetical protein IKH11_07695 [Bacteroidales bacterium]|nr:hypothetical protein [Bacteroidales bacterium]